MNIHSIKIKNLLPGEEVKMVLRRHWIALVYIFLYIIIFLASIIFFLSFGDSMPIIGEYLKVFLILYTSVFLLFVYIKFMSYELDIFIITTKRVIGLEEVGFLNRHISECLIDKVQEVNGRTTGLLSNLLNYGEVTINTASEASDFKMKIMVNALENARLISNHLNQYKTKD